MFRKSILASAVAAFCITSGAATAGPEAEVLHWWTSGGEAKSVAVLMEEFAANGGTWTDMPVAGGGGDAIFSIWEPSRYPRVVGYSGWFRGGSFDHSLVRPPQPMGSVSKPPPLKGQIAVAVFLHLRDRRARPRCTDILG